MKRTPTVSIGLPVYNGQRYIRFAIDSLLAQTFADFELIISDNCSTDGTPDICLEYAAKDKRIRYYRNDRNLGASANFNRTFELAGAPYFKWASYDDICGPLFLSECVQSLEKDPALVLAYPRTVEIDENGQILNNFEQQLKLGSHLPQERFGEFLTGHSACYEVFGVIRRTKLAQTSLIGPYISSDRNLLAELALMGPFREIPEYLFFRRNHIDTSWNAYSNSFEKLIVWFDTSKNGRIIFPYWKILAEYIRSVYRVPLTHSQRAGCWRYLLKWTRINRHGLQNDLLVGISAAARKLCRNSLIRQRAQVNT